MEMATGNLLWTLETEGPIVGSPVIVSDMIVVGSDDGNVRLVRLRDGSRLDSCNVGDGIRTPFAVQDGFVYFGVRDDSIRSIRIKENGNPDEQWVYPRRDKPSAC